MPTKDKVKQAEYARRHYEANTQAIKDRAAAYTKTVTEQNRTYIRELKEDTPCTDCGKHYPAYVMDFDHVSGNKLFNVASMIAGGTPLVRIKQEIAKCEIVCANCHRIRTHERRQNDNQTK